MDTFDPNDSWVQEIRQRMVPGGQVRDLPQYPADDIKKGQNHDKIEKALGNITASCVARTRTIKSKYRLLTDWQTEILEIMEANGVSEENIGKVLDLL